MSSSFSGSDLFGSGPHRFFPGPRANQLALDADTDPTKPGFTPIGLADGEVLVRGRLIAADDAALHELIDNITSKVTDPPATEMLVDHHGHTYSNVTFISFIPEGRIDRGRTVSLAYTARFLKLGGWS